MMRSIHWNIQSPSESFRIRVVIADNLTYPDVGTVVRVVGYLCDDGIQEEHRECANKLN